MQRIAVFPGSFDPVTKGHQSLVMRAAPLFDKLIVAIGGNIEKTTFFSLEQRFEWLKKVFAATPHVKVMKYKGLTVDFCKEVDAGYILRGLRTSADFEFERSIGQINKQLDTSIETVFFLTASEYTPLNSSIVRDILRHGGNPQRFVPDEVDLTPYFRKEQ
ncbi:MAG: pantetheine-phosphate adenylyltransferase [Bacteroidales bacterium]|nr:pantetheine-phosphate adenylyltransferase [Bacteroidales bacterium]